MKYTCSTLSLHRDWHGTCADEFDAPRRLSDHGALKDADAHGRADRGRGPQPESRRLRPRAIKPVLPRSFQGHRGMDSPQVPGASESCDVPSTSGDPELPSARPGQATIRGVVTVLVKRGQLGGTGSRHLALPGPFNVRASTTLPHELVLGTCSYSPGGLSDANIFDLLVSNSPLAVHFKSTRFLLLAHPIPFSSINPPPSTLKRKCRHLFLGIEPSHTCSILLTSQTSAHARSCFLLARVCGLLRPKGRAWRMSLRIKTKERTHRSRSRSTSAELYIGTWS